jgi:hypothetical protein
MKNQYFGDVNDYQKYGLLRLLANNGQNKIGVCWMLTADDDRTDGKFISYLDKPQIWRQYDPPLFDLLNKWVASNGSRNVDLAQSTNILPGAKFHNELLTDFLDHRTGYFRRMQESLADCDLIFYDPDNGIEVKSTAKGRRNSAKYAYWDEIGGTFQSGQSLLLYQHFRREERKSFIHLLVAEFQTRLKPFKIYWLRTSQVVYFLCVQEKHADAFAARVAVVAEQWGGRIQVG